MEITERDAELAVNQLKELSDNLVVSMRLTNFAGREGAEKRATLVELAPYFRMAFCWIAISLFKILELWDRFGRLASDEHRVEMRALVKEIRSRGVEDFRNKVAAHLLNRDTREPLAPEQLQEAVLAMMRNDMAAFFLWLHCTDEEDPSTVTSTLLRFRKDILAAYPNVRITA